MAVAAGVDRGFRKFLGDRSLNDQPSTVNKPLTIQELNNCNGGLCGLGKSVAVDDYDPQALNSQLITINSL